MENKINVSLVIPTYNDEQIIIKQVLTCEKILIKLCSKFEIIIADDKSKDNTWKVLQKNFKNKANFKLFRNNENMGIAKNVRQLYLMADLDYVLFFSADGDWDPKDVGNLIKTQVRQNADIVIGKRKKKIGYTPYRHFISSMHRLLPMLLFGVDTIDPGGIKLINRKLIHVSLISKSQFFEAEIIIRAIKKGYIISYYPVVYMKPKTGSGYGGGFGSAVDSFIDLIKLRIAGFPKL